MSASVQTARPSHVNPSDVPAPGKRRNRAPAAGTSDDCFTCSNRSVKRDRRRPYCSQCLDDGRKCSGYKTQLTWSVGIASRGKLRGLSLPVAGTKKVERLHSPQQTRKRQPARISQPSFDIESTSISTPSVPSPTSTRDRLSVSHDMQDRSPVLPSPYQPSGWESSSLSDSTTFQNGMNFDLNGSSKLFTLPEPNFP